LLLAGFPKKPTLLQQDVDLLLTTSTLRLSAVCRQQSAFAEGLFNPSDTERSACFADFWLQKWSDGLKS
jgi:hypothetical protein